MQEKILETIVTSFTKVLISEIKDLFDEGYDKIYDEAKQFIGRDLEKYLTKQRDKYSHVKTLLRGNSPVYLYDIYYPLKLSSEKKSISTNSISDLMKSKKYITIIGDAGSGKSTLVKHLFLNSIKEKFKIPILVELRYLNESDKKFEAYVKEIITMNKLSVNSEILNRLLEKGKFIFFLDGYDELDLEKKKTITKGIHDFVNKYIENCFILTSRPYSNIEQLPLFVNLSMKDLSVKGGEIKGFVFKQLEEENELAEKIMKSIHGGKSEYIKSFLRNPLLLSLYILTFQSYASIPDKKYVFYRRVINALFSEHDSKTKLGFVREKLCGLNQEQFESILKAFCFISYFESKFSYDKDYVFHKLKIIKSRRKDFKFDNNKFIKDLKSAIALWVDDDGILSFTHRSLQEYFAALFIKELTNEENKRVFKKILNKFSEAQGKPLREIENLLTLLEEMDTLNYYRYYYLPILNELLPHITNKSIDDDVRSFINFFTNGIRLQNEIIRNKDGKMEEKELIARPLIKEEIYKTIQVHIGHTRKLFDYLILKYNENEDIFNINHVDCIKNEINSTPKIRNALYIIPFENGVPDDVFNLLIDDELRKITRNYIHFLNDENQKTSTFLENSLNIERDIVDLI